MIFFFSEQTRAQVQIFSSKRNIDVILILQIEMNLATGIFSRVYEIEARSKNYVGLPDMHVSDKHSRTFAEHSCHRVAIGRISNIQLFKAQYCNAISKILHICNFIDNHIWINLESYKSPCDYLIVIISTHCVVENFTLAILSEPAPSFYSDKYNDE